MAYDFDTIAARYDRMNHLMTAGLDRVWRERAVRRLGEKTQRVLDVGCGTGDMMLTLEGHGHVVKGIDISAEMLEVARKKGAADVRVGDAEALPYGDATFDAVTCAFGVRNFVNLERGLAEMLRVVVPYGKVLIIELSTPDNSFVRWLYNIYAGRIIPLLGGIVARNRAAYTYLPQSISRFPKGKDFAAVVERVGGTCKEKKLTFGVCRIYELKRKQQRT